MTDLVARRLTKALVRMALLVALVGAVIGSALPDLPVATPLLFLAGCLMAGAAWVVGQNPPSAAARKEDDDDRFARELLTNAWSLGLYLLFIVLLLVEALTVPAALGKLTFFGAFAKSVVQYFPALLFVVLALLAAGFNHHAKAPPRAALTPAKRGLAYAALGVMGLFGVGSLVTQAGVGALNADRAVFVLAGGYVALFFFMHTWTRMPGFEDVNRWMENEERLRSSNLLRNIVYVFVGLAVVGVLLTLLSAFDLVPRTVGLMGLGLAMVAMIPATFSVGVRKFVAKLHVGEEHFGEQRERSRVVLRAASVVITILGGALAVSGFLAFLAQVAGVELFTALLAFFVAQYPFILGIAMVPLFVTVVLRMRFESEEQYTDQRKAITVFGSLFAIVFAFFGIFIGSGMAEGSGIAIENAVLAMTLGVLALLLLVKARALLPGTITMIREAITASAEADTDLDLKENIQRRMLVTYIAGLVFIVTFVGYFVATSLGAMPAPGSGIGTDAAFFGYVLVGLGLLVLVVIRYFQGLNMDPKWKSRKKVEEEAIGKKRLTAAELHRYIVLGFSISTAAALALVGVMIQLQVLKSLGPIPIEKKFATDFFVFALLIGFGPYAYYTKREADRIAAIDGKFPEFLRDLAESQRAGMTLTEAVITASKGNYGMLTGEIRKMAAQIQWGVSFGEALTRFSKRVKTPLITRTVSVITQAANAGGNVVDVLQAAANDSREIQQILKERKGSMAIYTMIIYVAFFVFMGVVAIMNAQFLPEVAKAVGKAEGVNIGGLKFRAIDEQAFRTVFFHAAIIQGLGGGIVAGVMEGGKPVSGLKHAFIMIFVSWILFRFVIGG